MRQSVQALERGVRGFEHPPPLIQSGENPLIRRGGQNDLSLVNPIRSRTLSKHGRMSEREFHARCTDVCARVMTSRDGMSRPFAEADVRNHGHARLDGNASLSPAGKYPLVVPGSELAAMGKIQHSPP